jgi:hypothetical protein
VKRFLPLLVLLVALPSRAMDLERFEVSTAFAIPHNEPVIGEYVARYKAELDASVRFLSRITFDANAKAWGLQEWRTPEVVGHGFPDAWQGSDWSIETVRMDYNFKAGVDIYGPLQAYVEHHPRSDVSSYYWLTGFRYRLK